jgi:NAD(P)-dependent dehydrogenase (short-subunit alcohol dehydrogenase family)
VSRERLPEVSFNLGGKVVIVTGASSGLGVAFAQGFAAAGADVALGARRVDLLNDTRASIERAGRAAVAVQTDVTEPADCQRLVDAAVDRLGRVDILVNNAGLATAVPAATEPPTDFCRVVDVNLNGSYYMAQACARVMRTGSSIINVGSVLGLTSVGLPQAAYSASKAGIVGLTRDLAQQWTPRLGIRVNALAPGFFPTDMLTQIPARHRDRILAGIPAGRFGEPHEIVAAALFLASSGSSYITGIVLPVEGGMLTT